MSFIIEYIGTVRWYSNGVTLTSPTVEQSAKVMNQLKRQEHKKKHWKITLNSSSPESLLTVFSKINDCPVKGLYIWNTTLNTHCVSNLSRVLVSNNTIKELEFVSSPLSSDHLQLITNTVSANNALKILVLYNDYTITDRDIPYICQMLLVNKTLEVLDLWNCPNITTFGEKQIYEVKTSTRLFVNT